MKSILMLSLTIAGFSQYSFEILENKFPENLVVSPSGILVYALEDSISGVITTKVRGPNGQIESFAFESEFLTINDQNSIGLATNEAVYFKRNSEPFTLIETLADLPNGPFSEINGLFLGDQTGNETALNLIAYQTDEQAYYLIPYVVTSDPSLNFLRMPPVLIGLDGDGFDFQVHAFVNAKGQFILVHGNTVHFYDSDGSHTLITPDMQVEGARINAVGDVLVIGEGLAKIFEIAEGNPVLSSSFAFDYPGYFFNFLQSFIFTSDRRLVFIWSDRGVGGISTVFNGEEIAYFPIGEGETYFRIDGSNAERYSDHFSPFLFSGSVFEPTMTTFLFGLNEGKKFTTLDLAGKLGIAVSPTGFSVPQGNIVNTSALGHIALNTYDEDSDAEYFIFASPLNETVLVTPVADTFINKNNPNSNYGSNEFLKSKQGPKRNRILVEFGNFNATMPPFSKAIARFYITDNSENLTVWKMSLYPLNPITEWDELGATWKSPSDSNLTNDLVDGVRWYQGGQNGPRPFDIMAPISSLIIENNQLGWIEFDITNGLSNFLIENPTIQSVSFLLRNDSDEIDECDNNIIRFSSREGIHPPELIIYY